MSFNRDVASDQAVTSALLDADPERQRVESAKRPNWLGHRGKNADVDAALLLGATYAQVRGLCTSWRNWPNHKRHLLREHGLFVDNHGGLYRFAPIDPSDAAEEVPELQPEAEYPDNGDDLPPATHGHPQDNVVDVEARQRFHGFVFLSNHADHPAASVVHGDVPVALALLNETAERTIFVITGSDEAAVATAATAVQQVWNRWVNGQPVEVAPSSFVRHQGDWETPKEPAQGSFYVYEYRSRAANNTFYVGKGTNDRHLQHINDVLRKRADGIPPTDLSRKERAIDTEINEPGGYDQLVRIVAEFRDAHAELCAFVVERFLIGMVYGPFALTNNNLGQARFGSGQSALRWLCQPQPVRQIPDYGPLWVNAATQLIETGRHWQTTEVNLSWMLVQPYEQQIRGLLDDFEKTRLEFIGAGNNGNEVAFEWNVRDAPVRVQLVFSGHNTTVHINLRPKVSGWRQTPTLAAHEAYLSFINRRFGLAPDGQTRVRNARTRDCYFKPFAVGRADASFDYADPTSMILVQSLHARQAAPELNFQGAITYLLKALPPDAA